MSLPKCLKASFQACACRSTESTSVPSISKMAALTIVKPPFNGSRVQQYGCEVFPERDFVRLTMSKRDTSAFACFALIRLLVELQVSRYFENHGSGRDCRAT